MVEVSTPTRWALRLLAVGYVFFLVAWPTGLLAFRTFEEGTATFEKLLSAKTIEQAFEIQSSFAKRAYDDYMAQMSKLGSFYSEMAKEAYKPVEKAMSARR